MQCDTCGLSVTKKIIIIFITNFSGWTRNVAALLECRNDETMMKRRDKLWMALFFYVISSAVLLFIYENYFRSSLVAGHFSSHPGLVDVDDDNMLRTPASGSRGLGFYEEKQKQRINNHMLKRKIISDRAHTCILPGNKTITLPKSPNLIIAGAQKGGTNTSSQFESLSYRANTFWNFFPTLKEPLRSTFCWESTQI